MLFKSVINLHLNQHEQICFLDKSLEILVKYRVQLSKVFFSGCNNNSHHDKLLSSNISTSGNKFNSIDIVSSYQKSNSSLSINIHRQNVEAQQMVRCFIGNFLVGLSGEVFSRLYKFYLFI